MAIKKGNDQTFNIPEGQEIKDIRVICKKHGDVTDSTLMLSYSINDKETGKKTNYQCGYCIPCLNEYLMKLEKEGELAGIGFAPVLGPKTEEKTDDEVKEQPAEEAKIEDKKEK